MSDVPIKDFIVLGLPPDASTDLSDPAVVEKLDGLAMQVTANQYQGRRPRAIVFLSTEWLITSDWRDVETFQPAHDCAACRAGNDQAIATLKEFPDRKLALGNLTYQEVW